MVEYLIVGAVALAHHGFPRYTGDLDILVRNSPENARRLEGVLQGFGFGDLGLTAADFIDSYQVIQLGLPPDRIDLLTSITGVSFEEAWAERIETLLEGMRVNFIGRQALIQNKKATAGLRTWPTWQPSASGQTASRGSAAREPTDP